MASPHENDGRGRIPGWFLLTLGGGVAAVIAWFVTRVKRDELVAQAGQVAHPVNHDLDEDPTLPEAVAARHSRAVPSDGPSAPSAPRATAAEAEGQLDGDPASSAERRS